MSITQRDFPAAARRPGEFTSVTNWHSVLFPATNDCVNSRLLTTNYLDLSHLLPAKFRWYIPGAQSRGRQ